MFSRLRGSKAIGGRPATRQRLRAVVEASAFDTVEREAMDHAGVAIGDEQLARCGIECQPTERRSGIRHAAERDIGEQSHRAGAAVDLPDRPGSAVERDRTKQARHEGGVRRAAARAIRHAVAVGIGHDDRQSVGRGGGGVDVRRVRVVERERKHLADLPRRRREGLGRSERVGPAAARPCRRDRSPAAQGPSRLM